MSVGGGGCGDRIFIVFVRCTWDNNINTTVQGEDDETSSKWEMKFGGSDK